MSFAAENRKTLALAAPIIAGQLGQMLMGWADTLMVGRVGVVPLAACAFANTLASVALVFGFGVMSSVTVRASQAFGAAARAEPGSPATRATGKVYRSGLALGAALGLALCLGMLALLPFLSVLGQPAEVNAAVGPFLILIALSIIPAMLFTAVKDFAEALSRPWPPFWIILVGVALNVVLNYLFIFGAGPVPALGLTGAGLATLSPASRPWPPSCYGSTAPPTSGPTSPRNPPNATSPANSAISSASAFPPVVNTSPRSARSPRPPS